MVAPADPLPNPYVGPRAFTGDERERRFFFGRERETGQLTSLLVAERIVLLCAPSGAGKTSLIHAALIPRLIEREFRVLPVIRVGAEPPGIDGDETRRAVGNRYLLSTFLALEEGLPREARRPVATFANITLDTYLAERARSEEARAPGGGTRGEVLIFDQFEEILTINPTDREAKRAFFAEVGNALRNRNRWALFAMREEFMVGLDPLLRPVPTQLRTRFRLDLLGVDAALDAIQRPARELGVDFPDAAAQLLVDDLRLMRVQRDGATVEEHGDVIEPVQLQVVCYRLWEERPPGATAISVDERSGVGDVDGALEAYYDERVAVIAAATDSRERRIRDWFEEHLITPQDIRGQLLSDGEASGGLANRVIAALIDARLVRPEERRGATWYELTHDRFVAPIRRSNAAWREAHLGLFQRRAREWALRGGDATSLLRGEALAQAESWAEDHDADLSKEERDFLRECRQARDLTRRDQKARRTRLIAWIGSAVMVVLVVAVVTSRLAVIEANALTQRAQQAEGEARLAEATAESARARAQEAEGEARSAAATAEAARARAQEAEGAARGAAAMAEDERARALRAELASRLAAEAAVNFEPRPQLGLLLAIEAAQGAAAEDDAIGMAARDLVRYGLTTIGGAPVGQHDGPVVAATISPDGRWLATASGTVAQLFDLRDGTAPPVALRGHGQAITALGFSPDGRWLATGSDDATTRLWDLAQASPATAPRVLAGQRGAVIALAFNSNRSNRRWLATGSADRTVFLWDLGAADLAARPRTLVDQGDPASALAFSPDGAVLATGGGDDETIHLWGLETGAPVAMRSLQFTPQGEFWVAGIVFSPDGRRVAAASAYSLHRWELATGDETVVVAHGQWVRAIAVDPQGRIITAGIDARVRVWNPDLAAAPIDLRGHTAEVKTIAVSPDGRWLATGGRDTTALVWDLSDLHQPPIVLRGHEGFVNTVAFSPQGDQLVTASDDRTARRWSIPNAAADPVLLPTETADAGVVRTWDVTAILPTGRPRVLGIRPDGVQRIAVSQDGRWLATMAAEANTIWLWDLNSPSVAPRALAHAGPIWALPVFSPDSRLLVSGGGPGDGMIRLWDLTAPNPGARPRAWRGHGSAIRDLAISQDGQRLVTGSGDNVSGDVTVRVWNLAVADPSANPLILVGHRDVVIAVAISPDHHYVMSGSFDGTARIWDLTATSAATQPVVVTFNDRAFRVAISPDGRWAAAASWDHGIQLVRLDRPHDPPLALPGHRGRILALAISPDSRTLATGAEDHTVRLWDLRADDPAVNAIVLHEPEPSAALVFSSFGRWLASGPAAFSPDGRQLVTGGRAVRLYHLRLDDLITLACHIAGRNLTPTEWRQFFGAQPYRPTCPDLPTTATQASGRPLATVSGTGSSLALAAPAERWGRRRRALARSSVRDLRHRGP